MKTISEIRHANFLFLFDLFKRQVWASWPDEPERGMLRRMARTFDMSERWLSHVKVGRKPIGHSTARKFESHFGLVVGWMDAQHDGDDPRSVAETEFVASALMLYRMAPAAAQKEMAVMMRERLKLEQSNAESPAQQVAVRPTRGVSRGSARNSK